jgi:ankyrin repeat protein
MEREDFVKLLLDCGADVDMEGDPYPSPIEEAVYVSDCDILRVLFRYGVRVNTVKTRKMLHIAVQDCIMEDVVQCLVENGVAVNATDDSSQTALHLTASRRPYDFPDAATIAQILIEAGADMEAVDDDGDTVLIKAAGSWRFRLVQVLLAKGASINARNHDRCTALHAAVDVTPLSKFHSHRPLVGAEDSMLEALLESLLDPGADMSADDRSYSAMFDAAYTAGNVEILIFLARHGVSGEIFPCG